jgi:hypothetical protein
VAFLHQASSTKANLAIILLASTLRHTRRSRACSRLCSRSHSEEDEPAGWQ